MSNCELTRRFKVPLKTCQNSVIEHNLVTLCLSVEWAENEGDNPSLVIDITNKQPTTSYLPQNPSSTLVNSVHHHHQHQEHLVSAYQQQYYHPSGMNNYDLSSSIAANPTGDHNDVSSMTTTTTVVYNSNQPSSSSSSSAIEKIKLDLKSQLPLHHPPQPYLVPQYVIQAPPSNLNDPRLNMKMSSISPTSSIKPMPSVISSPYYDLQQPSISNLSQRRSLICSCPYPASHHAIDCPINSSNNQESHTNFSADSMHQPPMNQATIQYIASTPQTYVNDAIHIPSMSFPNPNLMNMIDPSSSITTIISQPSSAFLNNTSIDSTIRLSSTNATNRFQQPPAKVSQVIINNQPPYSTDSKKSRPRKKPSVKRNNLNHPDDVQTIHSLTKKNSPIEQQNTSSPNRLATPLSTQQRVFIFQDNSQMIENNLPDTTNDSKETINRQLSSHTNPCVRSPVELDVSPSQTNTQTAVRSDEMDQTISEVLQGKGVIPIQHFSSPSPPQQKAPLFSRLISESDERVTPTQSKQESSTYDSNIITSNRQNVVHTTQQGIHPKTLPAKNDTKQRAGTKSASNPKGKRVIQRELNIQKRTTISASHRDASQIRPSPVTLTSTGMDKTLPWSTVLPIEYLNQDLIGDSLELPDINHDGTMLDYSIFDNGSVRILNPNDHSHSIPMDDIFSPKIDNNFDSSTPPLPLSSMPMSSSTTIQFLDSVSIENSLQTSMTTSVDIYENFFTSQPLSSSSGWGENQVTSTVITPPNHQNNYLPEQPSYSEVDTYFDTNSQSQTHHTAQFPENNSKNTHSMNDNDHVQTSLKQQTKTSKKISSQSNSTKNQSVKHSLKLSKQQKRSDSIHKQSLLKPKCTRCGLTQLIDITKHEFPKQKGLVFECISCGNNSIRSNVSADERKRRLAKVAADHLNKVECQFCHTLFHSHNEYIVHLREDHESNKPL